MLFCPGGGADGRGPAPAAAEVEGWPNGDPPPDGRSRITGVPGEPSLLHPVELR